MAQVFSVLEDDSKEHININVDESGLDFSKAKDLAKSKAFEICENPMILSWKNGVTGEFYPNYECGSTNEPFWIRFAEARGSNLTITINDGNYIFMFLKM